MKSFSSLQSLLDVLAVGQPFGEAARQPGRVDLIASFTEAAQIFLEIAHSHERVATLALELAANRHRKPLVRQIPVLARYREDALDVVVSRRPIAAQIVDADAPREP